jgi:hypothetical protein
MSLFQTKAWQSAWWDTWGVEHNLNLIRPWGQGNSGIYRTTYRIKGRLPICSVEFVGCSYRHIKGTRTEYNRFSVPGETPEQVELSLEQLLSETTWSEAVFDDLLVNSYEFSVLKKIARNNRWMVRTVNSDSAWLVKTDGNFQEYLKQLGANTRLRLYNRRKVLETMGDINHENYAEKNRDPAKFLEKLNDFHQLRWGKPVYGRFAKKFNTLFINRISAEGGKPELMILKCSGKPVSVLYNVRYQGRVYNLQSGFEEGLHPKLSVGTLHLGYAIENAFQDEQVSSFDMLAGSGKNENYKARLATNSCALISLMLVRRTHLKVIYAVKDRWNQIRMER